MIKQWDYLDHDKEIRRSWQKRESSKLNRKKIKYKKAKQNEAFSDKEGININSANFIQGSNKAIDNTVLILILLKLISKVTKVINKVMPDARCRGNGKLQSYTVQKMKFSIKNFFSKCDQIHIKLRIW